MKRSGTGADRSRGRKLGAEERALWHQATRAVRPLPPRGAPGETPASEEILSAAPAVFAAPALPRSLQPLEPIQRRQKQRIARGIETIRERLDLHGKTKAQAHAGLVRFLRRAQTSGTRFVLVITGKGAEAEHGSSERGVLRRQVPLWLGQPELHAYVAGFEQAHIRHGGAGALYVRLRRARRAE